MTTITTMETKELLGRASQAHTQPHTQADHPPTYHIPTRPEIFVISILYRSNVTGKIVQVQETTVGVRALGEFIGSAKEKVEETLGAVVGYRLYEMEGALRAL